MNMRNGTRKPCKGVTHAHNHINCSRFKDSCVYAISPTGEPTEKRIQLT